MFNQPLSFDTSSVTDMTAMFEVRPARASPPMSSWVLPTRCLHRHRPVHALPTLARMSPPTSFLLTRQNADGFNQRLSFDVSSVTSMSRMFEVRPAREPCPPYSLG